MFIKRCKANANFLNNKKKSLGEYKETSEKKTIK